jgi:hypothetical protein
LSAIVGYRLSIMLTASAVVFLVLRLMAGSETAPGFKAIRRSNPFPLVSLLLATALALALPLLLLPTPFDTDAQGFGYLSLMIREAGSISSLAPWHPEISYLYAPGALILFASLSDVFPGMPLSSIMMAAAHSAAFLFVWLASAFGRNLAGLSDQSMPRPVDGSAAGSDIWSMLAAAAAALSVGMWTALLDSHYTAIFGLLFTLAAVHCLLRYFRSGRLGDLAFTVLFFAATAITHADSAIVLGLGWLATVLLAPLGVDHPPRRRLLAATIVVPLATLLLLLPWLHSIRPLLTSELASPFVASAEHWRQMTLYHGMVWPGLALLGLGLLLRRPPAWSLVMAGWLVAIALVSLLDWKPLSPAGPVAGLFRFAYPFSLAWHGPTIPYLALGTAALAWLTRRSSASELGRWLTTGSVIAIGFLVAGLLLHPHLLAWSKRGPAIYGSLSSANDVQAMLWLRDHSPADARVLNYPGDLPGSRDWEAHWAPVITERDSVYFRWQPFFWVAGRSPGDKGEIGREQDRLLRFWLDPADETNAVLLRESGIEYVLVPEAIGNPTSLAEAWRWKPAAELPSTRSSPAQAGYLGLVFEAGGAQVYRVAPSDSPPASSSYAD